jgi:deazaflavin-dependent oxidoreductase (nitroreductase family)
MSTTTSAPNWTPPRWLNAFMRLMLRTPGLQRLVGRSTALLTFTGRRSGRTFTTPVTYMTRNGSVLFSCHRTRSWWRNFATEPEIILRLAGTVRPARVRVAIGDEAVELLAALMEAQPVLAKVNQVELADGRAPLDQVARAAEHTKVMVASLR